jgi:hypothetical protein
LVLYLQKRSAKEHFVTFLSFIVFTLPIAIFTSQHGWMNILHNANHLQSTTSTKIAPWHAIELIATVLGLFGSLAYFSFRYLYSEFIEIKRNRFSLTQFKCKPPLFQLLALSTFGVLLLCFIVSFGRTVYANWPLPGMISAILLLFCFGPQLTQNQINLTKKINIGILFFTIFIFLGFHSIFGIPQKFLPTKKLIGWQAVGTEVEKIVQQTNADGVLTDYYEDAAEINFYANLHMKTYVGVFGERRMNQYDLWTNWKEMKGKTLLLFLRNPTYEKGNSTQEKEYFQARKSQILPYCSSIEYLNLPLHREWNTEIIQSFVLGLCKSFTGKDFPTPTRH